MDAYRSRLGRRGFALAAALVAATLGGCSRAPESATLADNWPMIDRFCTDCHNAAEYAGELSLEGLTPEQIHANPAVWEKVARKLRGDLMPPPGNPQPAETTVEAFVRALESAIDEGGESPRAAHVPAQRLTRSEYAIAVKDLVGVEIEAAEHLPTEIEVDGFDNVAAALSVSPAFLEQYVSVARRVADLAVGDAAAKVASAYFPPPGGDQDGYVDGMPLGTRGGMRFEHTFPADGEYRINISDLDVGLYPRSVETQHTLVVLLDRNEVFRETLGGPEDLALVDLGGAPARAEIMERFANIPLNVQAGVHEIAITFVERGRVASEETIYGFTPYGGFSFTGLMRAPRLIGGVEVVGPFAPSGVSRTASRDKIFVCEPESPAEERSCAEIIATNLARRAFRRPVEGEDVAALMPFFETGRAATGTFDGGIEQLLVAVLASPDFLYRTIGSPDAVAPGEAYPLSDIELASRLSFFLWSQGPDEQLLELAARGDLQNGEVLDTQVRRMLDDPRAATLVSGFALKWLNLDELESVDPDDRLFPDFDDELREAFATEIEMFVASVLLEDVNVQTLLTADYTFLNERLARHYGIESVHGPQFRRVPLTDEARRGLLGKGAVLLRTSYGDRTSPVLRGAWVLEKLMGTPPAPPPPNVETDLSTPAGERPKTVRVRLERHRESPSCNGCHGVIDPYGLALENFSVTGQWRDTDAEAGAPIDASTVLPNGQPIDGPVELRRALLRRPDQFVQALTQKLMMYALGRELEYHDMPQVRTVVRAAAGDGYRFSSIVAGVVNSDAFRMQAAPQDTDSEAAHIAARVQDSQ